MPRQPRQTKQAKHSKKMGVTTVSMRSTARDSIITIKKRSFVDTRSRGNVVKVVIQKNNPVSGLSKHIKNVYNFRYHKLKQNVELSVL